MTIFSKFFSSKGKRDGFILVDPKSTRFKDRFKYKVLKDPERDSYAQNIKTLAKKQKSDLYSNNNLDHTNIILSNMLSSSKKVLCLYEEQLNGDLLGRKNEIDLLSEFKKFLKKNGRIEIIIDADKGNSNLKKKNEIIERLKSLPSGLSLYQLNSQTINNKTSISEIPYFAIGDDLSYRIEDKNSPYKRQAFGSFSDREMSGELNDIFDSLKQSSKPIDLKN